MALLDLLVLGMARRSRGRATHFISDIAIPAMVAFFLLLGCDPEGRAFERSTTAGTIEAYEAFLKQYPSGEHHPTVVALLETKRAIHR